MKRNTICMVAGGIGLVVVAVLAVTTLTAHAQAKPIVWNMATNLSRGNATDDIHLDHYLFSRMIYEETGGRISISVKDNLFPAKETLYAVADGRVQIGNVTHNHHIGDKPLWGLPLLPFLFANGTQWTYAWLFNPEFQKLYQDSHNAMGLQQIAAYSAGPQAVWAKKKPLITVADFKGQKIRTSSMLQQLALAPLGATNVTIPFGELFTSVERGVIDGAITSVNAGVSIGLNEVCVAVVDWPITPVQPYLIVVNKKAYDALSPDLQQIVMRVGRQASLMVSYSANFEWLLSQKVAERSKVKVLTPTPAEVQKARTLMGKAWDSWFELTGADGKKWFDVTKAWLDKEAQAKWIYHSK